MKIALAQIDIFSGQTDRNRNIEKIFHYIDCSKCELGADVVIFPEMNDTGYDLPEVSRYSSD